MIATFHTPIQPPPYPGILDPDKTLINALHFVNKLTGTGVLHVHEGVNIIVIEFIYLFIF